MDVPQRNRCTARTAAGDAKAGRTVLTHLEQPLECLEVCAVRQLQDLDNLVDAVTVELVMDGIEVCCSLTPEVHLHQGTWVSTIPLQESVHRKVSSVAQVPFYSTHADHCCPGHVEVS